MAAVLLLACGDDEAADPTITTRSTTTSSTTTTTTSPRIEAAGRAEVELVFVDPEILSVYVQPVDSVLPRGPQALDVDPEATVTVQGPEGPESLSLAELAAFVRQRLVDLDGTLDGVPFTIEVTGRSRSDLRVTALQEVPPG